MLGLAPGATLQEIRKRYRVLARKHHPDMNPGDTQAAHRFRMVADAYQVLINPDKQSRRASRQRSGASAQPGSGAGARTGAKAGAGARTGAGAKAGAGARTGAKAGAGARAGAKAGAGANAGAGAGARTGAAGSARAGGGAKKVPRGSRQARVYRVEVNLEHVVRPGVVRVKRSRKSRRFVTLTIPAGADTGTRVVAQMRTPRGGISRFTAELKVRAHKRFRRQGLDLRMRLPIARATAAKGTTVLVKTLSGPVRVPIAPGSRWGNVISVPGYGIVGDKTTGCLYIELTQRK